MKRFTVAQIRRLGWGDPIRIRAYPFAGKYPTRLYWHVRYADGRRVEYTGKPSVSAVYRMTKIWRKGDYAAFESIEFDTKQWVATVTGKPRLASRYPRAIAGAIYATYHPYVPANIYLYEMLAPIEHEAAPGTRVRLRILSEGSKYKYYNYQTVRLRPVQGLAEMQQLDLVLGRNNQMIPDAGVYRWAVLRDAPAPAAVPAADPVGEAVNRVIRRLPRNG